VKSTLAIITGILLLALAFLLFTNIGFVNKSYSTAKQYTGDIIGPALKALSLPVQSIEYVIDSYFNLVDVKRKNADLKKRLDAIQQENQRMVELEKENERLKGLLELRGEPSRQKIAANVIGEDLVNWFRCIIIDKGTASSITAKMPVVTPAGLVGQTVEVNRWHTKVMIINDTNSAVDTYITGKHTRGIIEGTGQTLLKLKYVLKNDDAEVGDRLITSGKDDIYPKGISVGIITNINKNKPGLFADIDVMPYNNFRKLEEVLVVRKS
jgi:rod shape-determining protein MreC